MADDVKEVIQYRTFHYLYVVVSTCSQKFENLNGYMQRNTQKKNDNVPEWEKLSLNIASKDHAVVESNTVLVVWRF